MATPTDTTCTSTTLDDTSDSLPQKVWLIWVLSIDHDYIRNIDIWYKKASLLLIPMIACLKRFGWWLYLIYFGTTLDDTSASLSEKVWLMWVLTMIIWLNISWLHLILEKSVSGIKNWVINYIKNHIFAPLLMSHMSDILPQRVWLMLTSQFVTEA